MIKNLPKFMALSVLFTVFISFNSCKKEAAKEDPSNINNERGTGLVIDDSRYSNIPFASPSFSGTLPASFDLSPDMPPVGDQGQQGSCVAWATGYCLKSYQEKLEKNTAYSDMTEMSPAYIYNQIKVNSDCNSGSNFDDAFKLLELQGVCSLKDMPYDASDCSRQPNASQRSSAASNIIDYYKKVSLTDLSIIKSFIYQKSPIVIGVHVDKDFMSGTANSNGKYIWKANNTDKVGYHAIVVVGYDDNLNAFKIQNSYGTSWGNNGYAWIDYNYFMSVTEYAFVAYDKKANVTNTTSLKITGNCPTSAEIGTTATFQVTITNDGTQNIKLDDIKINSTDGVFSLPSKPTLPKTLAPNETLSVTVNFKPIANESYTATFEALSKDLPSGSSYMTLNSKGGTAPCSNQVKVTITRFRLVRQVLVNLYLVNGNSKSQIGDALVLSEHDMGSFYDLQNGIYKIECLDSYDNSILKTFNLKVASCIPDNTSFEFIY